MKSVIGKSRAIAIPPRYQPRHCLPQRRFPPGSHLTAARAAGETFTCSTTVLGELYFGAYASQRVTENLAKLAAFAAAMPILDLDPATAEESGRLKAEQKLKGKPIPTADAQIAATARLRGLVLLSGDAHFQGIERLVVRDWLT